MTTFSMRSLAVVALLALVPVGCGSDDGASVTDLGSGSASGSASGSGSGSGSGSSSSSGSASGPGSASASGSATGVSSDGLIEAAVDACSRYLREQIDALVVETAAFPDVARTGGVERSPVSSSS